MDTFLKMNNKMNDKYMLFLDESSSIYNEYEKSTPLSMWIKEKDKFYPTINSELTKTLPPGIYNVNYTQEGFVCEKIDQKTDELFKFNNSISEDILKEISKFWNNKTIYRESNIIYKRGILMYGYPGTGKSSYISLICEDLIKQGGVVFKISSPSQLSNYKDFIPNVFRKIQQETPIITILEDIDKYSDYDYVILDFLDGHTALDNHLFITTSNNLSNVPDTLLRPSRIDLKIKIDLPDENTREEYLKFKGIENDDLKTFVKLSEGLSIADLKEAYICFTVFDYTIEESIDRVKSTVDKQNYKNITDSSSEIEL